MLRANKKKLIKQRKGVRSSKRQKLNANKKGYKHAANNNKQPGRI
jgi:hypothetical protein